MKKLLNTLFVTAQGAYLAKDGETVAVRVDQECRLRVPIHTLSGIVCFGQVTCSAPLMGFCAERGVALSLLTEHGRFLARVQGPVNGNVLLRRTQYRRADDEAASSEIARQVIRAKIANCRTVMLRGAREKDGEAEKLEGAAFRLGLSLRDLGDSGNLESIRGREGEAARSYFSAFDDLITASKQDFFLRERSRRPPLDNVNALLSFLYTLLVHDVIGALEAIGLDPAVGFLHRDRPGRPGLALDLMEELRAVLVDRLALSLINRRQVLPNGFRNGESGGVVMEDGTRKEVLMAWQKRKQEEFQHPFLGERIPFGLLPHVQALLLARYLRGDLDAYPAFFWR